MSLIYFMRRSDGVGPIKIGCSKVPAQRLQAHQVWAPEHLEIAATAPGTFADEQRIHRQFADYRLHGEWFEASRPVLSLLARVVATGSLPPVESNDKFARIEQMYREGMTLAAIGEAFGVSRERIRQILRKSGVPSLGARPEVYRKVVTLDVEAKIVAMGKRGTPQVDIARELGLAPAVVGRYLAASGVTPPRKKIQPRPETVDMAFKVAADYRANVKPAVIATKYGIPAPHIFRLLKIAGVKPNRGLVRLDLPRDDIVALYKEGRTAKDIASRFGAHTHTIKYIVKRAGALRTREENEAIRIATVKIANARRKIAA